MIKGGQRLDEGWLEFGIKGWIKGGINGVQRVGSTKGG